MVLIPRRKENKMKTGTMLIALFTLCSAAGAKFLDTPAINTTDTKRRTTRTTGISRIVECPASRMVA